MSSRNLQPTSTFDLPVSTLAKLEHQAKNSAITDAVNAAVSEPERVSRALLARVLSGQKVSKPVRVATTLSQETRERIETLSEVTGLSKNQVVALALEANHYSARMRQNPLQKPS